MAEIVLKAENFVNGKLYYSFGLNKQAVFTIVDEEFSGANTLGRINRVTCMVRTLLPDNTYQDSTVRSLVIGLGDAVVGARTDTAELRGKQMTKDNMEQCVVILYEE